MWPDCIYMHDYLSSRKWDERFCITWRYTRTCATMASWIYGLNPRFVHSWELDWQGIRSSSSDDLFALLSTWIKLMTPLLFFEEKNIRTQHSSRDYVKNSFLKFLKNCFAELLPFFYISLRFLCKFEDQLRKNQWRFERNSFCI